MRDIVTFIVDPVESVRERLADVFGPDFVWVGHDSIKGLAQAIDDSGAPAVAVLGPGVHHDEAIMLARSVHDERLPVGVVRVVDTLHPDQLRDAMRAGVVDMIERHADPDELMGAVKRARDEVATHTVREPRVEGPVEDGDVPMIAVAAGKGGVGASLVATNLAASLASRDLKVTLVDLDVRGGDLAIMMQQRPSLSVLDALDRIAHLDVNAVDGYLTRPLHGVRILAAPVDGQDVFIDPESFDQLLGLVGQLADVVVVDVGDTFRPVAKHVMGDAERIVLVTTLEVPAIRGTRRLLADFAHAGLPTHRLLMVANRADASTGLSASDAEKTLETSFVVSVADDKRGARSVNEGDPLVNRRRSKAAKGINELAGTIYKQLSLGS